jgi:hypothetical protein
MNKPYGWMNPYGTLACIAPYWSPPGPNLSDNMGSPHTRLLPWDSPEALGPLRYARLLPWDSSEALGPLRYARLTLKGRTWRIGSEPPIMGGCIGLVATKAKP